MQRFPFLILLICSSLVKPLYGDIQVNPIHVHLDTNHRMARLAIKHTGRESGEYKISVVFLRMNSEGALSVEKHPILSERSAVSFLRFSPKQVTLTPNIEQVVRVMAVPPKNLAQGEYRAHIQIEPLFTSKGAETTDADKTGELQLPLKISVAVPLIFQQGTPPCKVGLGLPNLIRQIDKSLAVEANLTYTGDCFPYGDLYTFYRPRGSEQSIQIGMTKGISSYIPNRILRFPADIPNGSALGKGTLKIEFRKPKEDGGEVLASAESTVKMNPE